MKPILIAYEENPNDAQALAKDIEQHGFETRCMAVESLLTPSDEMPDPDGFELVMVPSDLHKENETYQVCQQIRDVEGFSDLFLLVAVNMYQMPLANRVKEMPHASFIFTPIDREQLHDRIAEEKRLDEEENEKG